MRTRCWTRHPERGLCDVSSACSGATGCPESDDEHDLAPLHLSNKARCPPLSHAEHASATSSLPPSRFSLHLLADLDIDLEELGNASIQTNGFSFVEIAFSVICRYAFLRTRLIQSKTDGQQVLRAEVRLELLNLLNMSEIISTSVSAAAIFSAEESCGFPPKRKDILGVYDEQF